MRATVMKIRTGVSEMEFEEVETDENGHIDLDVLQKEVGGGIERCAIHRSGCESLDLWLNESGKLNELPLNVLATRLTELWRYGDFIVGDVLVCGCDGEGNSVGLTEAQVQTLKGIVCK